MRPLHPRVFAPGVGGSTQVVELSAAPRYDYELRRALYMEEEKRRELERIEKLRAERERRAAERAEMGGSGTGPADTPASSSSAPAPQ